MTFQVFLRNGRDFTIKADDFSYTENLLTGELTSYQFKGVTENKPCFLKPSDIMTVVRKISDEFEEV